MNIKIHNPNSGFALKDLPDDIILARSSLAWGHGTPFRNKMFMLDEMNQQKRYIICNVLQMGDTSFVSFLTRRASYFYLTLVY